MSHLHSRLDIRKWTINEDEYNCFNNFINTSQCNRNILRKILSKYAYIPPYIDVYNNIKQYNPKGIIFEIECLLFLGKLLPIEGQIVKGIKKIIADNNLHIFNNVYVDKEKTTTFKEAIDKTNFDDIHNVKFFMSNLKFLNNDTIEGLMLYNTEIITIKVKLYQENAVFLVDYEYTWIHKTLFFLLGRGSSYKEFYEIKIKQFDFLYETFDSPLVLLQKL